MPILSGDMPGTIKSFSWEIAVTNLSFELCEACLNEWGIEDYQPIFADSEMDRNPSCDKCGYTSFIFSPTSEYITNWVEMLWRYVFEKWGNVNFLDDVSEHLPWATNDVKDLLTNDLYRAVRRQERKKY